jgi:mitochondrial fission protein ELM1
VSSAARVWVLLGKGTGGNGQMLRLAEGLGWPYTVKRLVYNPLEALPNLLLGASRLSVAAASDPLEPPWPEVVIAASRRSAPVARWIKRRSGGRTVLVHLLHAQAPLASFDLVITLPQYRLPPRENVMCLAGALNRIEPERLAAAAGAWEQRFAHLPRPWIGLLVGGDSSAYRLCAQTAARLGREASELARRAGGALLVTTSPRTSDEAARALFGALDAPHVRYRWRPDDPENPYLAYLALADRFVVTVDSASLPMEACATGKPVQVFDWPRRRPLAPLAGWRRHAVEWGLVKPARDFAAYQRALRERGLVTGLGDEAEPRPRPALDELARVVGRIQSLVAGAAGAGASAL